MVQGRGAPTIARGTSAAPEVNANITVVEGDFLLIPEGVPHQVTGFSPELYMVTLEIPRGVKAP